MNYPTLVNTFEVTATKSTKAKFFEDVKEGDLLVVTVELRSSYRTPRAQIKNLRTGQTRDDVLSRIGDGLRHLTYKEAK